RQRIEVEAALRQMQPLPGRFDSHELPASNRRAGARRSAGRRPFDKPPSPAQILVRVPPAPRYVLPVKRPLQIFAFDPMLGRAARRRPPSPLAPEPAPPGPAGSRGRVVDADGPSRCYYEPVDLDAPAVLMQGGLEPTESDPRFHQQMVFAVATKVLENFDFAL